MIYDINFYKSIKSGSSNSSEEIIPIIIQEFKIGSVLDIGCGTGTWLNTWLNNGIEDVFGVDGHYVNPIQKLIEQNKYLPFDIKKSFDLNRKFDIVTCLEVAEHVEEECLDILLNNLTIHSNLILFSAAQPGQGGLYHLSEKPLTYWIKKFHSLNFLAFDFIRPKIYKNKRIEPWYKYNILIFVKKDEIKNLSSDIYNSLLNQDDEPKVYDSFLWIIRRIININLPYNLKNIIAKFIYNCKSRY